VTWEKANEVGNIVDLGTKFSEDFGLTFLDKDGKKQTVVIGCYGIGTTRLIGAIAEIHNDANGINWPKEVAPFDVELVGLNLDSNEVQKQADEVQKVLAGQGLEVLFDNREDMSAGGKFKDADLIGIPTRIVISNKTVEGDKVEVKKRGEEKAEMVEIKKIKI
jgi:prolyl-tRNA synthetase